MSGNCLEINSKSRSSVGDKETSLKQKRRKEEFKSEKEAPGCRRLQTQARSTLPKTLSWMEKQPEHQSCGSWAPLIMDHNIIILGQKEGVTTGLNSVEANIQCFYECTHDRGWKKLSLSAAAARSGMCCWKTKPSDGCELLREEIVPVLSRRKLWSRSELYDSAAVSLRVNRRRDDVRRHRWYYSIPHFMSNARNHQTKLPHETPSWWASATRPKAVSCFRRMMIEHYNNWIMVHLLTDKEMWQQSLTFGLFPRVGG